MMVNDIISKKNYLIKLIVIFLIKKIKNIFKKWENQKFTKKGVIKSLCLGV